jgi:flagellar motor component MotA
VQIIGIILLCLVVVVGFSNREMRQVSAFDIHALFMVVAGSMSAVLLGSSSKSALRTLTCLREFVPGMKGFSKETARMNAEREQVCAFWREGKRAPLLELSEKTQFESTKTMINLLLRRAPEASTSSSFMELRHAEIKALQPAINNWEMLSKLGPSFGMVGTITGMIQLFRNMSEDNMNIGAAMSLALLATLYGVAFGAGIAGPIGHYLNVLMDDRLGMLERCEKSINDLVSTAG